MIRKVQTNGLKQAKFPKSCCGKLCLLSGVEPDSAYAVALEVLMCGLLQGIDKNRMQLRNG